ncbi:hypothetical protein [Saccharothrix obliqua]|uniref:hypothetical protein n=1 Tax=Saccharothrix obliqua TaxID=2861747 RepID=UPI001C5F0191|nr:hypothetical protein [Saccharothrix obliqua]MBW4719292.1 hypothetical protein [Saccharothrix obliqua]
MAIKLPDLCMVFPMARHAAPKRGLFRRRPADDLLERSIRTCPDCTADVHVFAEVCRHCGGELELAAG